MEPSTPIDTNLSNTAHTSPAWYTPRTRIGRIYEHMSPFEKLIAWIFGLMLAGSSFALAADISVQNTVVVPARGGTLVEGIVGAPRFINPLLAISDADRDMSALIYSGLVRHGEHGSFIPDLAATYDISEDGTTYTFNLRPEARFHDGEPVTAEDVLFTIMLAQQPEVKSPKRADWEGVTAELVDERTIRFILPRPYGPFLENATIGILPKHLWGDISAEELPFHLLNTEPVGSGPFKIASISKRASGSLDRVELKKFDNFTLDEPYLDRIIAVFYANEDAMITAFNAGDIDSLASIAPENIARLSRTDMRIHTTPLSRVFAVFFNQAESTALSDIDVRRALDTALDKEAIIEHVLRGYGVALDGPIPRAAEDSSALFTEATSTLTAADDAEESDAAAASAAPAALDRITEAQRLLDDAGWDINEETGLRENDGTILSIRIATGNTPALTATAEMVADTWRALGVSVSVEAYNTGELNTNVIRPRAYEALLFGEIVGRTLDLFAFWHSSQRSDPGLNLALYANPRADRLLAEARATADTEVRDEAYASFSDIIAEEMPAIFLYAPEYMYVAPQELNNVHFDTLTTLADRFAHVHTWYRHTERVWPIFDQDNQQLE